jgi:hypothetical protein
MGIKDQFQDKAERLQQEAGQRANQHRGQQGRQDERPSRDRSSSPQHEDERSRRSPSQDDIYDEDTI